MKRIDALRLLTRLAFLTALVLLSTAAFAADITAVSCENKVGQLDVQTAVNAASTGDTVVIPAGTCLWTVPLAVAKAITLQGQGIDMTTIQDGVAGRELLKWTCVPDATQRLTGIRFSGQTKPDFIYTGIIQIECVSTGTTRFRLDHNVFDNLKGFHIQPRNVVGVFDHNTWIATPTQIAIYAFNSSWRAAAGDSMGDNSWTDVGGYGTENFPWGRGDVLYIEDNTFNYSSQYVCMDGNHGRRVVFRFNSITKCTIEGHGTESFQRYRSAATVEMYLNTMDNGGQRAFLYYLRGGTGLFWGNTGTNMEPVYTSIAHLVVGRTIYPFFPFGPADGRNPWDINDPLNPFDAGAACPGRVCRASLSSSLTVSVLGAGWRTDQWKGHIVRAITKGGAACRPLLPANNVCHAVIVSNTSDTLTFSHAGAFGPDLAFSPGDTFEINRVIQALDQVGVLGGSLLTLGEKSCSSWVGNGTRVTATCRAHGLSVGDWVAVQMNTSREWAGARRVETVPSADTFTFSFSGSTGSATSGSITKVPAGWNNQVKFPIYQWLNVGNGRSIPISLNQSCIGLCRENEHFYNYTQTFNGTAGVGSGNRSSRPATCTPGVAYWSTDQGSWNQSGTGAQGVLDMCVTPNTWVNGWYTPYVYPHPLSSGNAEPPPVVYNPSTSSTPITTTSTSPTTTTSTSTSTTTTSTSTSPTPITATSTSLTSTNSTPTPGVDTVKPVVSITDPLTGTVSGVDVLISAWASDNVRVAGVRFFVDDNQIGSDDITAPYSVVWDATRYRDGNHTIRVIARDTSGNEATVEFPTTVNNSITTTYNVARGGASSLVTTNASDTELVVTHARLASERTGGQTDAGALAGVAIVSLKRNGVLVTETGAPATPPIRSGRIYAEWRETVNTGIALSNPSSQDAVVSFYFSDASGIEISAGAVMLRARQQVARFLNQPPFNAPLAFQGSFTFQSSIPIGAVALRGLSNERGEFLFTTLPVVPMGSTAHRPNILPQFADGGGWTTQLMLTNSSDTVQSGIVEFVGQGSESEAGSPVSMVVDGIEGTTFSYWLPPRTSIPLTTGGTNESTQVGSIRVVPAAQNFTSGETPGAVAILSFRKQGITITEAGVAAASEGSAFRMYMESSGTAESIGSIRSGVAIVNPYDKPAAVSVELRKMDGSPTEIAPAMITVPPRGQVTRFIHEVFPSLPETFQGVARLTTPLSIAALALRSRYNERGDFLITNIPPLNENFASTTDLIFPHIVSGLGYKTQLTVFGNGGSGQIYLFTPEGYPEGSSSFTVPR